MRGPIIHAEPFIITQALYFQNKKLALSEKKVIHQTHRAHVWKNQKENPSPNS